MVLHRWRVLPTYLVALGAIGLWSCTSMAAMGQAPRLNALLLSGQNNHDWRSTTPALKRILEDSGRFTVDVTEHPEQCTAASLARYAVIVSNWNAFGNAAVKEWPETARAAVLDFVRGGKGFAVVHAGSSSFYDWREYQQMAGASWDLSRTGHGAQHAFYVQVADPGHPITHGLRIFLTRDELWHRAGTASGAHPLVTAYSSPESGGSGQDEPLAFVTEFGKGRGFTLLLGHDANAMASAGFRTLLCRGTEWAATAKVTLPVPASLLDASQLDIVLGAVRSYSPGDRHEPLTMLEYHVARMAMTPAAGQLAAGLSALAEDRAASLEGRRIACRMLGLVGMPEQVPVLARLLPDSDNSTYARMALERIPGPASTDALRSALGSTSGPLRVGLINSLGARRDAASVAALTRLTRDPDRATATAALGALGRTGTPEALKVLTEFRQGAPAAFRSACIHALLECADVLVQRGHSDLARGVYRSLVARGNPGAIRAAAFTGLVLVARPDRSALVLGALRGTDADLRRVAARLLASDSALAVAASRELDRLPADVRPAVIAATAAAGERGAVPAIVRMAAVPDVATRAAAASALGVLGDAGAVPVLAKGLADKDASVRAAARDALVRLRGADTDQAIAAAAAKAGASAQRELIRVLVARSASGTVPALLALAKRQPSARPEAAAAIAALGSAGEIAPLLDLLSLATDDARSDLEAALASLCMRANSSAPVRAALPGATGRTRVSLLNVLGAVGGKEALPPLREALTSPDAGSRLAAIKALSAWPDSEPLDDLLTAARTADDPAARVLALRGIAQVASNAKDRSPDRIVEVIQGALAIAQRAEERRALVSALGTQPSLSALSAIQAHAADEGLREEADLAALQVADSIWRTHPTEAEQTARSFTGSANQALRDRATAILWKIARAENLAIGATAVNTDGLHPDGQGGPAQCAIDGDPATYWDEDDNQKLYGIRVQLAELAVVGVLRIQGYQHHMYAPRDFDVLLDGKVAKSVSNAQYTANWLTVDLPPTRCSTVELRITGYYGQSPAIRELEIYRSLPRTLQGVGR